MSNRNPERRSSLLDVTPARRRTYAIAFTLFSLLGYAIVIWRRATEGIPVADCAGAATQASAAATAESYMIGFAIAHAAALGLSLVSAEITGGFMVIADYLREKWVTPLQEKHREEGREKGRVEGHVEGRVEGREEGLEEGRDKGIDEANDRWLAWNRRRLEAEARGEPFHEPLPYSDRA